MNTQELFAEQLATTTPYTIKLLDSSIAGGRIIEGSAAYHRHLAHVGEKMLFVIVYHEEELNGEPSMLGRAAFECYFESEIDGFLDSVKNTHTFDGYNNFKPAVPRFLTNKLVLLKKKTNEPT